MKDKSIASVKHLRNCDRNFFALSTVRGAVVYLRGCFKSRILCLFNTLTGDCKSRLQRQNPPARVVNCLIHRGGETSWGCRFPSPKLANPFPGRVRLRDFACVVAVLTAGYF